MFQKKINSFNNSISWQNKDTRRQQKQSNLQPKAQIDCDNFLVDPLKNLAKDLTKPIWNCITKVNPKVIYRKQSAMQPIDLINTISRLFQSFFLRLKNQHQDQSNLKININGFQFQKYVTQNNNNNTNNNQKLQQKQQPNKNLIKTTNQLFQILLNLVNKQLAQQQQTMEYERIQQQQIQQNQHKYQHQHQHQQKLSKQQKCMLIAAKQLFLLYLQKIDQNFNNQLDIFNKIVINSLNDMINCKIGSLVLCIQPKLMTLPLLIHPILISIHSLLKLQLLQLYKQKQIKINKNINCIVNGLNSLKITKTQKQLEKQKQNVHSNNNNNNIIFNQFSKSQNLSKIVFINFDGYQSQFNINIAKYLCKSLMYISFPKQSNYKYQQNQYNSKSSYSTNSSKINKQQNQQMKIMENQKSQRLLRKYYLGHDKLSSQQKQKLLSSYYKSSQKQLKKNLYIFPIHSRSLSYKQNIKDLQINQTSFISFIMKQLLFNQILQFNPSIIIVSYSQKINIENQFFIELMKQLTVISNYKIVFYTNLAKSYLFQEYYQQQLKGLQYKIKQQKYFNKYQQNMKLVKQQNNGYINNNNNNNNNNSTNNNNVCMSSQPTINCDIFEKMAIMIKISSGTYNLNKYNQPDCYIQKYKNYKAMAYAGPLIRKLSQEFYNLSKLKMRLSDYMTTSKVLEIYFHNKSDTFDRLFMKSISKYHINLFKEIQSLLFPQIAQNKNKQQKVMQIQNMNTNSPNKLKKDKKQSQIQYLINQISNKYALTSRKQNWISFKFQKMLQISTQKVQSKYFAHLPRYKQNNKQNQPKKQADNLICLQFFTVVQKQKTSIQLSTSTSKVYYTSSRKYKDALIYVTNHLIKTTSTAFTHFCGVITEQFDYKVSPKVQLHTVNFFGGPTLSQFQTYTQFNYFQTKNYVFMFWPKLFDSRKQLLLNFNGINYKPQSTNLFFSANRKYPDVFNCIYESGKNDYILPRHGCKCYQVQGTNTIYIFGGFYGDQKNYLYFQTDITKLQYESSKQKQPNNKIKDPLIKLQNMPKKFYFDFEQLQTNRQIKIIKNLKNDMVRPRILYQFLQSQQQIASNLKTVFLIGGIGQNFIRPYSMIGHMAHKLIFNLQNGNLQQIQRISMQNIIPINTYSPVKMRGPMQAKILSQAQNRSINFITGQSGANSFTICHNNVTYNHQNQRFQYQNQYQFCDSQYKNYRQQVSLLRKTVSQSKTKLGICAKNLRGKDSNTNFITVTLQNQIKYILQLQLLISLDVKHQYKQLPTCVRLTGQSILSIDLNNNVIYALIRHAKYTLNQCILAFYDLNQLSVRFRENKPIQIQLKQLYKFDQNVSHNVLIAANVNTILLLHGLKFEKQAQVTQMILRRNRKKHLKIDYIQNNLIDSSTNKTYSTISTNLSNIKPTFYDYPSIPISGGLSCSIFLNQTNGNILCFSFKTVNRNAKIQIVYVVIQRLDLSIEQRYVWQTILNKTFQFVIQQNIYENKKGIMNNTQNLSNDRRRRRQKFKLVQIIQHKKQQLPNINNNNSKFFCQIIATYRDQCYSAQYQIDFNNINYNNEKLIFMSTGKSQNQYYMEISKSSIKQYSFYLEKNIQDYNQLEDQRNRENLMMEENQMMDEQAE